jgi:hypothetical protein
LRALLSIRIGRAQATRIAARIGQILAVIFGVVVLYKTQNPFHILLAAFIYVAAGAEAAQVAYEERTRGFGPDGNGEGAPPPGYYWVDRGNGLWQLAPLGVKMPGPARSAPPWL